MVVVHVKMVRMSNVSSLFYTVAHYHVIDYINSEILGIQQHKTSSSFTGYSLWLPTHSCEIFAIQVGVSFQVSTVVLIKDSALLNCDTGW